MICVELCNTYELYYTEIAEEIMTKMRNRGKCDARFINRCCDEFDESMAGSRRCSKAEMEAHVLSTPIINQFRDGKQQQFNESGLPRRRGFGKRRLFQGVYYLQEDNSDDIINAQRSDIRTQVTFSDQPVNIQPYTADEEAEEATDVDELQGEHVSDSDGEEAVGRDQEQAMGRSTRSGASQLVKA